jgi:hypothetical protein
VSRSQYQSASGKTVTLYTGPNGSVTVVEGEITCYDTRDEMYGAPSLEAALRNIGYSESEVVS